MLLRRKGGEAMGGFKVFVPVLVFRLEDRDTAVSMAPQDLREPSDSLNACLVVIQSEEDVVNIGVLLQHPEHGVFAGAAECGIVVALPLLLVQC